MGGEKPTSEPQFGHFIGSPPRGRGKDLQKRGFKRRMGITPAWAGKRNPNYPAVEAVRDHPRVGGEKAVLAVLGKAFNGSPPRGRGKVKLHVAAEGVRGITPAWAGKRGAANVRPRCRRDHPRVGGEKFGIAHDLAAVKGSPPRGRGKGQSNAGSCGVVGITPAWAGKRLKRSHRSGIFISGPIPFHSVLHRPAGSGGSRAGRDGSPAGQPQNTGPA